MSRLSGREQAVWDKRNAGLTFKQIAKDLGLCPATVSFAYRKAYRKIEYGKAMKISKLTEYELLGSIEDIKSIHRANQRCEKIIETSLRALKSSCDELEKKYMFAQDETTRKIMPLYEYFLDQARKELEDERN